MFESYCWDCQKTKVELWSGDFKVVGPQVPSGVNAFVTDPPYGKKHIHLFHEAGRLAMEKLVDEGLFITYTGQMCLPEVMDALRSSGLTYLWTCAITHRGGHNFIWPTKMICGWKPILIFQKTKHKPRWKPFLDICKTGKQEQSHHKWQQALAEAEYFINKLVSPGSLIVDPMCGSGTTLIAAQHCGVNAIGIEVDPEAFIGARNRLEKEFTDILLTLPLYLKLGTTKQTA